MKKQNLKTIQVALEIANAVISVLEKYIKDDHQD